MIALFDYVSILNFLVVAWISICTALFAYERASVTQILMIALFDYVISILNYFGG